MGDRSGSRRKDIILVSYDKQEVVWPKDFGEQWLGEGDLLTYPQCIFQQVVYDENK